MGLRIRSLNTESEARKLIACGVSETCFLHAGDEDVVALENGRAAPTISALLTAAHQLMAGNAPTIIARPDVLPAIRNSGVIASWLMNAQAVGLTPEACILPELFRFETHRPVRRSLAAVVLSAEALATLIAPPAEDISPVPDLTRAFGIPGWDVPLGQMILRSEIGGHFMDSGLLLLPGARDCFAPPALPGTPEPEQESGFHTLQLRDRIRHDCTKYRADRDLIKALYFHPVARHRQPSSPAMQLAGRLTRLCPEVTWTAPLIDIAVLADHDTGDAQECFTRSMAFFMRNQDPQFRFTQVLLGTLFCLLRRTQDSLPTLQTLRGDRTQHLDALAGIRAQCPPNSPLERVSIAHLFGKELIEDAFLNPRLYNYLIESCETDGERQLLSHIRSTTESAHNAA